MPEESEYKLYYAQSLYQACLYEEAMKVTSQIDDPAFQGKVSSCGFPQYIGILFRIIFQSNIKASHMHIIPLEPV